MYSFTIFENSSCS